MSAIKNITMNTREATELSTCIKEFQNQLENQIKIDFIKKTDNLLKGIKGDFADTCKTQVENIVSFNDKLSSALGHLNFELYKSIKGYEQFDEEYAKKLREG